jgi:hypothetical protein
MARFDTGFPGVNQSCSSAQDCSSGEVCCSGFGMGGVTIACAATCGGGVGALQLCASSDECPSGDTCVASPFGMNMYCQAPRMMRDGGVVRPRRDGGGPTEDGGGPTEDGGAVSDGSPE